MRAVYSQTAAYFKIMPVLALVAIIMDARSKQILEDWAKEAQYTLVSARFCSFGPLSFFWKSDNQEVYYVTIQDRKGRTRRGYVLCGGWFSGLSSNDVTVKWDDKP